MGEEKLALNACMPMLGSPLNVEPYPTDAAYSARICRGDTVVDVFIKLT